ncbi:MAG: peptide chain release factor 2 [Patescibacteria group bacterium]|nr:peptide chain release factor 2 [Patescibacteria group bacterium]
MDKEILNNTRIENLLKAGHDLLTEIDLEPKQTELTKLKAKSVKPDFWDKASAQEIMQRIGLLRQEVKQVEQLKSLVAELQTYQELSAESGEGAQQNQELKQEIAPQAKKLAAMINELKMKKFLSGKFDQNGAILSIHPGQGGTEAQDWAEMLERMYLRFFERKSWKFALLSEIKGEEAGIKEVSFEVKAPYAYGYLKGERGTHRLVRQSPFNADNLRQTSFALVEVLPVVEQNSEIELKSEDLSWNFTRAGGPGGQSVNKTNSAVELTHKPSNTTVKSRQSRSQVENKQIALKMLKAKLAHQQEKNLKAKINQEKGQHTQASWGTQIRNYVLHPYHLVKDTRTDVETNDTDSVLDGNLDQFIKEEIKLDI